MSESYRRDFVEHLKRTLSKGYKDNLLRVALIKQGYSDAVVDRAIGEAKRELAEEENKKVEKEKPQIKVEIYDEKNRIVNSTKKPFWKRLFGR